jgi:Sugar-transfer associated ATP-grasp
VRNRLDRLGFFARRAVEQAAGAWRDARQVAAQNGVSTFRVLRELAVLNATRSLGVRPYFQYRLFDPGLSPEQKRRYLPDTPWANARLWSRLNPKRYRSLYANKLIFNRFFAALGLPVAKVFGVYDPTVGYTSDGSPLRTPAQLREWLPAIAGEGFVFKAIEGVRGHSILVFTGPAAEDSNMFVTLAGERYDAASLIAFAQDTADLKRHRPDANQRAFLIEERIRPHPTLAAFIGPTLCSVRIQTIIAVDGSPKIIAAVFKLQPKPVGVDHLIYGAVGCWVDLDSGVLTGGRTRDGLEDSTTIPGTGTSFIGFQLPEWPRAKELALRAAAAFPWARSIGWDIGISDRGPVLIEGNEEWSPSLIQMPAPHGLMTGEFEKLYRSLGKSGRSTSPDPGSVLRSPPGDADSG